ncbi:hypothetical protein JYB87_11860 [Shewanella avicenniae]|uniref:Capsid protein n=1 Tax=Shewanella avicenniae TaxID=2814294 RepID=A0ABX7QLY3_9GAMM|nr:hypothetical protein [Shewanella avicenniae]QSX32462.1 hypothetical protein JYB87_11860 [Shewanella avicenniae]
MGSKAPFVVDSKLTAIAIGYRNAQFIADMVAPRFDVPSEQFKWTEFDTKDVFTIPNTFVGRKGVPNTVEFSATEKDGSVNDYGLSDVIPQSDIIKARDNPSFDPEGRATVKLTELVALDREKRVASLVMNASTYNHSELITGTDKWTDPASKPIDQITDALNTPMVTPNIMVMGRAEALALRKNPQIIRAYHGNTGEDGLVPLSFIRELFELDEIIVGASRYNTANKGQAMNISNLWSGGVSLIYRKQAAQLTDDVTFMLTPSWQGRIAYRKVIEPGELGIRGGVKITVGDSTNELVIASEAGYFLEGVV